MAETTIISRYVDLPFEEIRAICQRHHVRELSLFGSVLRDHFGPASDVDFLVEFQPEVRIGFIELGRLEQELAEMLERNVDLVTKRSVRPELREEILGSPRVLYEAA
jgi:uncharacterized protein